MTSEGATDAVQTGYLDRFLSSAGVSRHPPSGRVYHYTNGEGLLGILTSKCLRAGHVAFLNDTTEYLFGRDRIHERLAALNTEHRELVTSSIRVVWERFEGHEVFAVSFCDDPDLVPQWRGYGGAGGGYSLGFNAPQVSRNGGALFGPVIYGERAVADAASATLAEATAALASLQSPAEEVVGDLLTSLAVALLMLAICSKNAKFSYEQEYRLVSIVTREADGTIEVPNSIDFRSRGGLVVPYTTLPLPTRPSGAIALESVCIGPTQGDKAARRGLELLLEKHGITSVEISSSAAPVRFL